MATKHNVAPRFVHFPELRYAQLICNKCATWTFAHVYESLYGHRPPYNRDFAKIADLRALKDEGVWLAQFVRDPYERFISAYEYFRSRYERFERFNQFFPQSPEMAAWYRRQRPNFTFEAFLHGAITEFPLDKHIAPQHGTHEGLADFVWPLEDSAEGWLRIREHVGGGLPTALPQSNPSSRSQERYFTAAVIHSFEEFYAADIEWHRQVCDQAGLPAPRRPAGNL